MKSFLQKFGRDVIGVLSGFDRLVFRGTIRRLAHVEGMLLYLSVARVLLKEFGKHVLAMSEQLKSSLIKAVEDQGRPVLYLSSSTTSKEQIARAIAEKDDIREGTICLIKCVEPCRSFEVYRDRESKRLRLEPRMRKCLFLYLYEFHPVFGFMSARIQSWFPFSIQICLNGREWLARQMERAGIAYKRRENCFVDVKDVRAAQRLLDGQLKLNWPRALDGIARRINPAHDEMFGSFGAPYYWSVYQSEWATDFMFRQPEALGSIYRRLVHFGITTFGSTDVMRFLGRKVKDHVHGAFRRQIVSDLKHRPEGIRLKHRLGGNQIKLYDKQGSVLRAETTINDPTDFKVFRPKESDRKRRHAWQPMRQGVADLHRRAKVSQAANTRYIEALAAVDSRSRLGDLIAGLCRPAELNGRPVRGLRPWADDDLALLRAVSRSEFAINGMRNRDLCALLFPPVAASPEARRKRSGAVTRSLRMLRAHGLIQKVPRTHRYVLTKNGAKSIAAIIAAHHATTEDLVKIAG